MANLRNAGASCSRSPICYFPGMTRQDIIAHITSQLADLDDEAVQVVAAMVANMAAPSPPIRDLTERELALIEEAKADFREGRTYSPEEALAYIDEQLAMRRARRSSQ
jgi:hypothetical protein